MKLKYYLRGLGLGILVTAVILMIVNRTSSAQPMSDREVMQRAAELGMIENKTLEEHSEVSEPKEDAKTQQDPQAEKGEDAQKENDLQEAAEQKTNDTAGADDTDDAKSAEEDASETESLDPSDEDAAATEETEEEDTPAKEDISEPAVEDTTESERMITIVISGGDSSYRVATKLYQEGLVEDAAAYDTYLCENGYDRKLRTGTFQIPAGASDGEIARKLTGG